jgi:hypothetical protein
MVPLGFGTGGVPSPRGLQGGQPRSTGLGSKPASRQVMERLWEESDDFPDDFEPLGVWKLAVRLYNNDVEKQVNFICEAYGWNPSWVRER